MPKEQIKKIGNTHINAKIQALTELAGEIESEGYTSINQVVASITSSINILNDMKAIRGAKS